MFYNMLTYSARPGLNMVIFSDEEAQPLRVREPVVVEPVVSQAAPEEAVIRDPVRNRSYPLLLHPLSGWLSLASLLPPVIW